MVHVTTRLEDPELSSSSGGGGGASGWAKLALLQHLMLAHPEVEWLWWLDVGALVTDMGFELPLARYKSAHLMVRSSSARGPPPPTIESAGGERSVGQKKLK
jgi:xyloglucan 6-xylosyltransferase